MILKTPRSLRRSFVLLFRNRAFQASIVAAFSIRLVLVIRFTEHMRVWVQWRLRGLTNFSAACVRRGRVAEHIFCTVIPPRFEQMQVANPKPDKIPFMVFLKSNVVHAPARRTDLASSCPLAVLVVAAARLGCFCCSLSKSKKLSSSSPVALFSCRCSLFSVSDSVREDTPGVGVERK